MHREVLLLCAVAALSVGTMINFGVLAPIPIVLLLAAALLMAFVSRGDDSAASTPGWACAIAATASCTLVYEIRFTLPIEAALSGALLITTVLMVLSARRRFAPFVGAVAAVSVLAMAAVAWHWGSAPIDVFGALQNASAALIHGQNPYVGTFMTPTFSDPGHEAMSALHFPYLPGAAIVTVPARLLGDVRLASVVAFIALTAFAIRMALQSPDGRARAIKVAALCLALPMTVAMMHYAWVDVYSVVGFAGWVALRRNHPRWAIVMLALSFTIKPTILVAVVPAWLWSRRARREILAAAAAALLVMLPFIVATGIANFYQDVVGAEAALGFRYDGLTLSAEAFALTGSTLPAWFGPGAGAILAFLALRRRPKDVADVLVAGAFLTTASFLLAKWAFLNYYFIPVWLLTFALAGRGVAFDSEADVTLPALLRTVPRLRTLMAHPQGAG